MSLPHENSTHWHTYDLAFLKWAYYEILKLMLGAHFKLINLKLVLTFGNF